MRRAAHCEALRIAAIDKGRNLLDRVLTRPIRERFLARAA